MLHERDYTAAKLPIEDFEGSPCIPDGTVDVGADAFHTLLHLLRDDVPCCLIHFMVPGTSTAHVTLESSHLTGIRIFFHGKQSILWCFL